MCIRFLHVGCTQFVATATPIFCFLQGASD
jgi:hypothetical protein